MISMLHFYWYVRGICFLFLVTYITNACRMHFHTIEIIGLVNCVNKKVCRFVNGITSSSSLKRCLYTLDASLFHRKKVMRIIVVQKSSDPMVRCNGFYVFYGLDCYDTQHVAHSTRKLKNCVFSRHIV